VGIVQAARAPPVLYGWAERVLVGSVAVNMRALSHLWNRWASWGGVFLLGVCGASAADLPTNPLAVAHDANGRLELFQIGFDGEVRHRWQRENNGHWSPWSIIGGSFLPGIAVGLDADQKLEVFAIDRARNLNCARQAARDGHEWSSWTNLGGAVEPPVILGQDADGRLEVFALDAMNREVKHLWQTNRLGGWSRWGSLGRGPAAGLAVATSADGRLELFGVDENHHLVHCWQRQTNAPTDWSAWTSLGGAIVPGLAVGQGEDARLEVFAVGSASNEVERIVQTAADDSAHWGPWTDLGGSVRPGVALGQNADGRLEVFAVKSDGSALQHRFQLKRHEDNWLGWRDMDAAVQSTPVIGRNRDGTLEIFALDERNGAEVIHRRQIVANYHWLYWSSMDRSPVGYSRRVWQTDEGLPNDRVQALAQTPDGFLWVGTFKGLARFDGVEFKTYNEANTPQLKSASITALLADAEGALWIGTEGGGLARLAHGQFSLFTTRDGLAGDNIRALCQCRDRTLWVATTSGLSCLRNGKFQTYTTREGLRSDAVTALCEDRGSLWVATVKGLNQFRGGVMEAFTATNILAESLRRHWTVRPGTMDLFAATDQLSNDSARSLCLDKTYRLWIGAGSGLMWYDTGNFYAYTRLQGLSDSFVTTVYEDSRDNLWVGTYSGLDRFMEGRFHAELNDHGVSYGQVNVIFEDTRGDVWVGLREGLVRLTPKPFSVQTQREGLSHNHVTSVLEDHLERLWVGTSGGGLNQVTQEKVLVYGTANQLSSDYILALCEGKDGSIWAGADNSGGLFRLKNQSVTHYTARDGLVDGTVSALHEDPAGDLWIGTRQGLCRLSGGVFVTETNAQNQLIRAICEAAGGQLWFGGDAGLMRRRNGTIENLSGNGMFPAETVSALYADPKGSLWVGTLSGGLLCLQTDHWARFGTQNGLLSNEVLGIVEDHDWLWLTSTKGIFRVRPHDLEALKPGSNEAVPCIVYGKADGLESIVCGGRATPSVWKTADDRLCFATSLGLAIFDAYETSVSLSPPPVSIDQAQVDGRLLPPWGGQPLVIPPSHGELGIRYAALDLRSPEKCRFKYRLEGVDSDWVDAGAQRAAYYNNLAPGSYRFHVLACNKDGVQNETSLDLELRPHFWQTLWFRVSALTALVGLAGGSARLITQRKMQRRLESAERKAAIERERGRIAKDIHDDLGSSLTRIMLLGQRAKSDLAARNAVGAHLEKIINFSRNAVQAMDEIVWAVNPRHDNLDGLVDYLVEYATQFFQDAGIRLRLETPLSSQLALPAEVRHGLFLATKEAFNNVLKHSLASEVRFAVAAADSTINILIDDNGRGFDPGHGQDGRQGNGLQNMRKRLEALGGQMQLQTAAGQGTKLRFVVRIPAQPLVT
jgi:ligand-binding sensor domain-containing protein/signal transduction histidine kinase